MTERPITVDAREAKGLHDGTISRIVRVVDPQPDSPTERLEWNTARAKWVPWTRSRDTRYGWLRCGPSLDSPFGVPGDRLAIQEDFAIIQTGHSAINAVQQKVPYDPAALYRADGHNSVADAIADTVIISGVDGWEASTDHWRAAETMPRWACRTILDVTDVRVIRVQEVTEEDALGVGGWKYLECPYHKAPVKSMRMKILTCDTWDANKWIWLGTVAKVEQDRKTLASKESDG